MMLMTQMANLIDGPGRGGGGFGGRGFGPGDGFGFLLPGLIGMLLLAALIGLGLWLLLRNRASSSSDPLRHAAARYAAGKIGRVEFERIRADLAAAETATPATTDQPADSPPAS